MQTALYGKLKESREKERERERERERETERERRMVNWSKRTKHFLVFNFSNTTQDKTKLCKVLIDEG